MILLWIFKKTELPTSVVFVSKFEKKYIYIYLIKMISIYTWFFTAVSFRNMTGHSDISPQTIGQSTSVLPQTALTLPVCFHCVLSTAMCLRRPCPLSPTQAACVACVLDLCPRPIQSTGTRAPCVLCFSTFLSPDISPVPGRTLKWLCAGRGPLDLCSLASVPWFGGGPYHPSQSPHNNAIKGMLYIPHVVLQQKLDG